VVSASEKLRALLDAPLAELGGQLPDRHPFIAVFNALPQLVAVVAEQENFSENMWTVQSGDGEPFVSAEGLRYLREHLARADAALAALDEALS
jgi:hypothetical protein